MKTSQLALLPIEYIIKGSYQPRIDFNPEALQQLARSITTQGIIQAIVVRKLEQGANKNSTQRYELIAGERRWRAAQLAGLYEIPAIVRNVSDQAMATMSLIENIQREALKPLEQAYALRRLINEFGLTHQQTASEVGRSRSSVTNLLRLLELGHMARKLLTQGKLEMGHARALLSLSLSQQADAAQQVVQQQLSVRATERLVKRLLQSKVASKLNETAPEIQQLEQQLSEKLGAKLSFNYQANGSGKLVIEYHSLNELEGILAHIH
jgi:ParB family chromosome partitioning protein